MFLWPCRQSWKEKETFLLLPPPPPRPPFTFEPNSFWRGKSFPCHQTLCTTGVAALSIWEPRPKSISSLCIYMCFYVKSTSPWLSKFVQFCHFESVFLPKIAPQHGKISEFKVESQLQMFGFFTAFPILISVARLNFLFTLFNIGWQIWLRQTLNTNKREQVSQIWKVCKQLSCIFASSSKFWPDYES